MPRALSCPVMRVGVSGVLRALLAALTLSSGAWGADEGTQAPPPQMTLEQKLRAQALRPENFTDIVQRMNEISYTRWVSRGDRSQPFVEADRKVGQMRYDFGGKQYTVDELFTRLLTTGIVVLHDGKLVYERYRPGSNQRTHFMSYSAGKSITAMLIAAALHDGSIASLDDPMTKYAPELVGTAYEGVTIKQALQMSSGVRFAETYTPKLWTNKSEQSDIAQLAWHSMILRDASFADQLKQYPREAPPGTVFNYSTLEAQVLAFVIQGATHKPLAQYLEERIWSRIGMEHDAALLLDLPRGVEGAGGGYLATVRDFARLGQLMLQDGVWNGERILPKGWVQEATIPTAPQDGYGKLPWGGNQGYGYLWYAIPGPDRAFTAEGVHGQMIYVNPATKVVIARTSAWPMQWDPNYGDEAWTAFAAIGNQLARRK